MPEGTLEVELIKGHGLEDVEAFGKSDPYVILRCGHVRQRSRTVHDGGSDPVWSQSFLMEIPDGPTELDISILDQERHGADEQMGTVVVPLAEVFTQLQCPPCKYKVQLPSGKTKGDLELRLKFFPKVHHGTLEVHLLDAHGLVDTDIFSKPDPYAIIYCQKEFQKSKVLRGTNPMWDQKFQFHIDSDVTEIVVKLFDEDSFKVDDPMGTVVIPLHKSFSAGLVGASPYKVLGKLGQPQGEINVALTFTPEA